jgi:dTDP-4-amino-4,6-dideoxygalactose transaminase
MLLSQSKETKEDVVIAYITGSGVNVGADILRRGLSLPSDNKMTAEQQDRIIEIIHGCFR